jgi:Flp pilus assembly protein TadG
MVEFALSVGLLVPVLLGVFQFGYSFYTYNRLIVAVRGGARYGALRTYDSSTSTPSDTYLTAVKNAVVYGNPSGGMDPIVAGLTTGQVGVSVTMDKNLPNMITVYLTSFTVNTIVKNMTWAGKPAASFRFEGRYAP